MSISYHAGFLVREQKYVRDLLRTALNVIDVSLLTSSSDEFSDKLIDSHATEGIEGDISDDNKHEFWKQRFVQKCCEYSGEKVNHLLSKKYAVFTAKC